MPLPYHEATGRVRTKIVATIGPASWAPEVLRPLIAAGVDVFRLNFAHGDHDGHAATLAAIREVAAEDGRPVAVLQDLGGPKIRLGAITEDRVDCGPGDEFILTGDATTADPRHLTCTYANLADDLQVGDPVLFADGAVSMRVVARSPGAARLAVVQPGTIRSHQGINLPGAKLKVEALTDKDLHDLGWTAAHPVEYVGLSFVRRAADVERLRRELEARAIRARIVAKIEKPEAVADLDAILGEADAVMVARGDLGVELDVARVPAIQKRIIAACRRSRVPVITATQMLTSMELASRPTRAEASDVFNAVLDGTDAVMLSGETAVGSYPVEAVATMSRIVAEAEAMLGDAHPIDAGPSGRAGRVTAITEGVVEAASLACRRLGAALLVVATHTGRTALVLSKQRHATPTLALADDPEVARAMALYWGVTPLVGPEIDDGEQALTFALDWARARGLVQSGDRVVLLRGTVPGDPVHNAMLVQVVA